MQIWDTRTSSNRRARKFISAHQDPVYTIDWHPDGNYLASGSRDRTVKVRPNQGSAAPSFVHRLTQRAGFLLFLVAHRCGTCAWTCGRPL